MGNVVSTVTFTVSHDGDNTDMFQEFVETVAGEYASGDIVMMDYTVEVDVPDPLADALKSITWDERAKVDSGQTIAPPCGDPGPYCADHNGLCD